MGFVLGSVGIGLGYPGQPHILIRFMAVKDTQSVKQAGVIAVIWSATVFCGAILLGLATRVYYGTLADPEQALPIFAGDTLHPVFSGLALAGILSAIWSTADTQLMVLGSTFSRDLYESVLRRRSRSREGSLDVGHVSNTAKATAVVLAAAIGTYFALTENRVIFTFVLYAWSALGAGIGPAVILGLSWKRTSTAGAIAGMVTGSLVTVIWKNVPALSSIVYELVPAFVLAFLAVVLVSLWTTRGSAASREMTG